jgi:hypothetical protein
MKLHVQTTHAPNVHPLYSTLLDSTRLYSTPLYSTLLYSTLLYSTLLYSNEMSSTLRYSTLFYSTLLYSALLYSTLLLYSSSSLFGLLDFVSQTIIGGLEPSARGCLRRLRHGIARCLRCFGGLMKTDVFCLFIHSFIQRRRRRRRRRGRGALSRCSNTVIQQRTDE